MISSFQSQYGIRLSRELRTMKWDEFKDLLIGIGPDTALGRVVSIRAEEDKETLKHFTPEQHRIRNEWRRRRAKNVKAEDMEKILEGFKQAFLSMGGVKN